MNIHQTIVTWAAKADPDFQVNLSFHCQAPAETGLCTHAFLRIEDPLVQKFFDLAIVVPHERRTPYYSMGPEQADELRDPLELSVPDFSDEQGLCRSLDLVHKRFLMEFGGQRLEDPDPDSAPDVLAIAQAWADWKNCGITVSRKDGPRGGSVLVFIPGRHFSQGVWQVEIRLDRSLSQSLAAPDTPSLNTLPGYLPPFFTASELRGALEAAFSILKQR